MTNDIHDVKTLRRLRRALRRRLNALERRKTQRGRRRRPCKGARLLAALAARSRGLL